MTASEEAVALCWRELHIDDSEHWPWMPRCQRQDASQTWQDIGGPAQLVSPLRDPALAIAGEGLLAGWVDNSSAVVMERASQLVLSQWLSGQWRTIFSTESGSFPADPALAIDGSDVLLAAAVGEEGPPGRSSRRIDLYRINPGTGAGEATLSVRPTGAETDGDFRLAVDRLEHPVLHSGEDGISMAFISYTIDVDGRSEAALWQTQLTTQWSTPALVDSGLLGHITPAFDRSGVLHWVRHTDGGAALCAGSPSLCTDLGTDVVRGLAIDGDTAWVSILGEERSWSLLAP